MQGTQMTMTQVSEHIRLATNPRRVRAMFQGHVIADSDDVIDLYETNHGPVQYFPREAVAMEYTGKTDRVTHCSRKGDASYYSIVMDGVIAENAIWSYEEPIAGMEAIRGRIAFYPDKVEVYELTDADPDSPPLDAGA